MAVSEKEEKLRSLTEMEKIVKHQQDHYTKILQHFDAQIGFLDERIATHDAEIATLQELKTETAQHFVEAPEQLIALGRQLQEISNKKRNLKRSEKDTERRTQRLKERIITLRNKLAAIGE